MHTALIYSGVTGRMEKDVDGTGAQFNRKGLMEHPIFQDWINGQIETFL